MTGFLQVVRGFLLALCLCLPLLPDDASGQTILPDLGTLAPADDATADSAAEAPANTTPTDAVDRILWQGNPRAIDYVAWDDIANRAEQLLLRNQAQTFVLERLRTELGDWRETFARAISENDDRMTTIRSQIAALGTPPADGETEAALVAERRALLNAKADLLAAPGLLAAEAHARATGLIREVENQVRDRQTEDLLKRNLSPLNPAAWTGALATLGVGIVAIGTEFTSGLGRIIAADNAAVRVALAAMSILLAILLFAWGQEIARGLFGDTRAKRSHNLFEFLRNVAEAVLPLIGILALTNGLSQLNLFGPLGEDILATIPLTGSVLILSVWLVRQFFPLEPQSYGPLGMDDAVRLPARRAAKTIAWLAALWLPYETFLDGTQAEPAVIAVLTYPVIVVISVVLFRFASLLRTRPVEKDKPNTSQGRTRSIIGRLVQGVAITAPIIAALGYEAAANALLFPTILTLGVIGVLVYLQSLAYQTYELIAGDHDNRPYALVPVVIGFVLLLLSAPVLALIWGAERAELLEYWTRFTEGFSFGDTTISPSDFMWFVVVFGLGYLLTQFVKTTLRISVLPRTRLDLGAQNAIVAGFGYLGIFLAAVAAITMAGIDLSNLAIVAGALSVGIGFGLQTIVSNFVSGIILLIERPISEGDWIEVDGKMGIVRDISVRSTRIETFDQTDVIVPNADLVSNQVINWTRGNLIGRLILPVGAAYGSDIDKVMGILREVAETHPLVIMNPPPAVLFMNFGADALEFEIRAILRDVNFIMAARSEMNTEIARRFAAAGIEIPFAQRDIWLRNPEVLGQSGRAGAAPVPPKRRHRENDTPDAGENSDSDAAD